jgi:uncharacterized protein (DUF1800 family)
MPRSLPILIVTVVVFAASTASAILDQNNNQQSDIWESLFGAIALNPSIDTDQDGFTNLQEAVAGTNPLDANSKPTMQIEIVGASATTTWSSIPGKRYTVSTNGALDSAGWQPVVIVTGIGAPVALQFSIVQPSEFFRLEVQDIDTDSDGLTDAEELAIGFDLTTARTQRYDQTDLQRVSGGWNSPSTVTVGVLDGEMSERWPAKAVVAIRRAGGMKPITVNFALAGSATLGTDYTASATNTITILAGAREVWVELSPIADADDSEPSETISLTLQAGAGYSVGNPGAGTINLANETAGGPPNPKAAARFLLQAAFGPDQDSAADTDDIPENVETVMSLGFASWIDDQFTRPIGYIQPWVDWAAANANAIQLYGNWKEFAWWARAMGAPKLRPDDTNDPVANPFPYDPLRQRVAFALSEILVASDRPEQLAVEQPGVANFYDLFEQHAFGNYRNLLQAVAVHPVMGIYLSHLGNQKANPATNVFPDENFAREVMQLFSIGLWQLNPDGTRQLNNQGQPIPTYNNNDITELARVFTGLSFGNNTNFSLYPRDFTVPMKGWDAYHDLGPKGLLGGLQLPARTASPGNTGTATMADVAAAIDNLFNHQNVGPFIAYRLIQRLVTSNPSPAYVGRVAAAFADNGSGIRGDMKAVIRAILLDPEARDPAMMSQPTWGKLREPFLRCVNLARAFNATSPSGYFALDQFALAHLQDPMNSPSVFNFFLPTHSPSGPIAQLGLTAPEFQIVNAATAVSGANYFWEHILSDLQYWGAGDANYAVRLNLNAELAMVTSGDINSNTPAGALDPDPLLRRLDMVLTGGTLSPQQFQIIREAMLRINPGTWQWHRERLRMAIYLITTSADFNVLR